MVMLNLNVLLLYKNVNKHIDIYESIQEDSNLNICHESGSHD
jgi:hypothetical protein